MPFNINDRQPNITGPISLTHSLQVPSDQAAWANQASAFRYGSGVEPIAGNFGQVGGVYQVPASGDIVPPVVQVTSSRALTAADSGRTLAVAAGLTITVPAGLPLTFGVVIQPLLWNGGSISVTSSGGALLNGATTTLTRGYTFSIINATAVGSTQNTYGTPTLNSHKVS